MECAKPIGTPLASDFKLTKEQGAATHEEQEYMTNVPYASAVGSLIYVIVCTKPNIAHVVGVVSRFVNNLGKEHWEAVKWVFRYLEVE